MVRLVMEEFTKEIMIGVGRERISSRKDNVCKATDPGVFGQSQTPEE